MIALIIFGVALVLIYYYNTRTFDYWAKKGVKYEKPEIFFGNSRKNFLMKQSRSEATEEIYWKYPNEKVVGSFRSATPELVIRDPEIVKKVLISDFASFYARGFHPYPKKIEKVMANLFIIEGDLWKFVRQRMTPAFTSGKLKLMFPLITGRAEKLLTRALKTAKNGKPIDARDLMARYTNDFIGCVGFGLDADSLNDENSEFRKLGNDTFNLGFKDFVVYVIREMFPMATQHIEIFGRIRDRVFNLVDQIKKDKAYKLQAGIPSRGDFVDLMMEYKAKGPIEVESIEKFQPDGTPEKITMELTDDLVAAQIFLFFGAGFETSSSTTSTTLHYLASNPDKQEKVHKEIDEVLARHNNKLTYDAVKEMTYLECSFLEGMRLFPALGHLMRRCTNKYTFEDINLTIDSGVKVIVPVRALHMDPQYWDNPKEFRPERFTPKEFTAKQKKVFFPFGEGPRNCIGARLGKMQSLAGLAAILSRFTVEPAPDSVRYPDPVPADPTSDIVQSPKGGKLPLIFKERKSTFVQG